jgi:hypothetical protein
MAGQYTFKHCYKIPYLSLVDLSVVSICLIGCRKTVYFMRGFLKKFYDLWVAFCSYFLKTAAPEPIKQGFLELSFMSACQSFVSDFKKQESSFSKKPSANP